MLFEEHSKLVPLFIDSFKSVLKTLLARNYTELWISPKKLRIPPQKSTYENDKNHFNKWFPAVEVKVLWFRVEMICRTRERQKKLKEKIKLICLSVVIVCVCVSCLNTVEPCLWTINFWIWKQTSDLTKENVRTKDEQKKHARLEMIKRNTGKKRALVHGYYNIIIFFSCVCVKGDYYLLLHWSIACTRRRRRRRTGLARMCRFFRVFIWFHQNDICKSKYAYTRQNYQTACFFTLFNWWECGMEKPKRCRRHAEKLTNSEISGAHMCVKCADREQ